MTEPILQFFAFAHLPEHLQAVSRPFAEVANRLVLDLPRNPERTVALRKLLEAKDAAVRALVFTDRASTAAEPTGEELICPERKNVPHQADKPSDTWRVLPNGDRTCSFCGSLHPDDYLRILKLAADEASPVTCERAVGKAYKWYVDQPGVRNALEGGIKFYTWHIPTEAWAAEATEIQKAANDLYGRKRKGQLVGLLTPKEA